MTTEQTATKHPIEIEDLYRLMELVWSPSGEWIAAIGYLGPPGSMLMRKQVGLISIDPSGEREEENLTEAVDVSLMNLTIDDLWGLDAWVQPPVF